MRPVHLAVCVALALPLSFAEVDAQGRGGAIKLFDATPVTESAPCVVPFNCSPVIDRVVFDEATLLLSCKAHPTAILASTPDGRGRLVADNFIEVNGTDICPGGNCFDPPTTNVIGMPAADAYQPIAPIDVSGLMPRKGLGTVTVSLVDYGGVYASTDIWLVTDCTVHHRVGICHKPGTPAEKTLTVGLAAIAGHLRHGDTLDVTVCRR